MMPLICAAGQPLCRLFAAPDHGSRLPQGLFVTRISRSASAWPNGPRIYHIARYREIVVGKSQLVPRLTSQLVNK